MKVGFEATDSSAASSPPTVERQEAATVLIVDDEDAALRLCSDIAFEAGLRVRTATTTEQALEILDELPVDFVITDLRIPELGGLELLRRVREHYPEVAVLVLTQYGTIQTAVEATRLGAADYVTKPFHIDELRRKLQRLIHEQELDQENRVLREQLRTRPGYKELIGTSPKMQRVYRLIEKVSQHNYPVPDPWGKRYGKGACRALDPLFRFAQEQAVRTRRLFRAGPHSD